MSSGTSKLTPKLLDSAQRSRHFYWVEPNGTYKKKVLSGAEKHWREDPTVIYDTTLRLAGKPGDVEEAAKQFYMTTGNSTAKEAEKKAKKIVRDAITANDKARYTRLEQEESSTRKEMNQMKNTTQYNLSQTEEILKQLKEYSKTMTVK